MAAAFRFPGGSRSQCGSHHVTVSKECPHRVLSGELGRAVCWPTCVLSQLWLRGRARQFFLIGLGYFLSGRQCLSLRLPRQEDVFAQSCRCWWRDFFLLAFSILVAVCCTSSSNYSHLKIGNRHKKRDVHFPSVRLVGSMVFVCLKFACVCLGRGEGPTWRAKSTNRCHFAQRPPRSDEKYSFCGPSQQDGVFQAKRTFVSCTRRRGLWSLPRTVSGARVEQWATRMKLSEQLSLRRRGFVR